MQNETMVEMTSKVEGSSNLIEVPIELRLNID